jgi:TolB-like protein/cytochrome c-type biogenesis protein CcmH/NrfG
MGLRLISQFAVEQTENYEHLSKDNRSQPRCRGVHRHSMTDTSKAVFLSYASQDVEPARRICEALRAGGIEVWFDQSELRGGDAWDASIRRQIRTCALFIPLISRNTHSREEGYFRLEWKLAVDRSHLMSAAKAFLLPIVVDATADNDEHVPDKFRELQWTRLPGGSTPAAFVERVAHLLSGDQAAQSARLDAAIAPESPSTRERPGHFPIWLRIVLGVVVAIAAYVTIEKLILSKPPSSASSATGSAAPSSESTVPVVNANSIAVLPFLDMSEKKDQEYFSDGLAETLLDLLAKTPGLHVIARTSSFSFKGKSDDIPTIANKLHVANILEGSVRRSGNHLRVTTQLIRAANDEHLWSETYDREMSDVFKVQDDIAAAVVAALKLKLAPSQKPVVQQTSNPEAYSEYLLGNQFTNRFNTEGFGLAVDAYQKAVALDPRYSAAYAGLSTAELMKSDVTADASGIARAKIDADRAVELAPEEAAGYRARSILRTLKTWDWAGARADAEKAIAFGPGEAANYIQLGLVLIVTGRVSEAITALRKGVELDPLSTTGWTMLARAYLFFHNFPAARESAHRALEISPNTPRALGYLGFTQLVEGQATEAMATFRTIQDSRWLMLTGVAMAEHTLGHEKESKAALDELQTTDPDAAAYQIAEVHAWRGEKDAAFEWFERAYSQRDAGLTLLTHDPMLDSLRGDPRFTALLNKLQLPQ